MINNTDETVVILKRAAAGDRSAFEELFQRHRPKLERAVARRMDRRVAGRMDASDIVQEAYMEAFERLPKYLEQESMTFYGWLYWIAHQKVLEMHRRHLGARKRTVHNEVPLLPVDSSAQFVSGLIGNLPTPSQEFAKAEMAEILRDAMKQLKPDERDLIIWRHFEQLNVSEIAQLLNITEGATHKRYWRALEHLRKILQDQGVSRLLR